MFKKRIFLLTFLIFSVFILSGCVGPIKINFGGGKNSQGGIYVTTDKGNKWKGMNSIPSVSDKPGSIADYNTRALKMDPNDHDAVYLGTVGNGLFYSYNVAEGWNKAKQLPTKTVNAIAVDPTSKCIIYTSLQNRVYKSTDCNRTWEPIYHDNKAETRIETIAVDHYDTSRIYVGTSRGEIIRSDDRGDSWRTIKRFDSQVKEIEISPFDSRRIFAATLDEGIFRSDDQGGDWDGLKENMEEFNDRADYRDMSVSADQTGSIFLATDRGLLKSDDDGESWERIDIITPEEETVINAIAVNPNNEEEIYYVTDSTFYRSLDGGENWHTRELPTSRGGSKLLIDFENPNIIYMGVDERS
ncbi:MAG: WD40/YVTN/BNR-like repeat-containing protein [Patescibacteria group bacterium]